MKHLSIRLPWHDRGWDGCVCNQPAKNVYCKGFHSVNAETIRRDKDDTKEEKNKGKYCGEIENCVPPCSENINAFGGKPFQHKHTPRDFIKNTSPKKVTMPANASGSWPFEDMWDEVGRPRPAEERIEIMTEFFSVVEKGGNAGLVFYYCNYDNPVSGDDKKYLLVGVARIKRIHNVSKWDDIPEDMAVKYSDVIWSRIIENDPKERVRLPYQEYIALKKDVRSIAVFAEGDIARSFKYVCKHISDDNAIALLDRMINSVQKVIQQKCLKKDNSLWETNLKWLKEIRKECWISRGLYPGLAATLAYLGFKNAEEYIRIELKKIDPKDYREYVFDRIEGNKKLTKLEEVRYKPAVDRYSSLIKRPTEKDKALLCRDRLPFFDIDIKQVANILDDKREDYCIASSLEEIYKNPYVLCEEYVGVDFDDSISFEKIDHGMIPEPELGDEVDRINIDDPKRLRAMMYTLLENASLNDGHTFMDRDELFSCVRNWHEEIDKDDVFNLDLATWDQHAELFNKMLQLDKADGIDAISLRQLRDDERILRKEFLSLINADPIEDFKGSWKKILEATKDIKVTDEQIACLNKLYKSRLGILTGTAGTGKTTVIKSLIKAIKQKEPNHTFLLLAPTGKASLILSERINDDALSASTIHSLLMRNGWLNPKNFTCMRSGKKCQISTVIIDECSMIDANLFATLIRALDMKNIERLVLVGDFNQLPPIGPGKVFYDLITYLKSKEELKSQCLAELFTNWRQKQGSKAALLADHYAKKPEIPDEDIFKEIEEGVYNVKDNNNESDLVVKIWKTDEDLLRMIPEIIDLALKKLDPKLKNGSLGERFKIVHGIDSLEAKKKMEAIHFIVPYRHTPVGSDSLNLEIQQILRGKESVNKYQQFGYVFWDKVLQIRNYTYYGYDNFNKKFIRTEENYIPNGTLGYVFPKLNDNLQVKFPRDFKRYTYCLSGKQVINNIELGYATSVHKAQGSQFDVTIMVLPSEESSFLCREMIYTALSRSTKLLILLVQNNINILKQRLWLGYSTVASRNTALFRSAKGLPQDGFSKFLPDQLIVEVLPDLFVRSWEEKKIAEALIAKEISYYYEKPLIAKDGKSWKIPDFTFKYNRKEYYWEHYGMAGDPDYDAKNVRKKKWYKENGYQDRLIETPVEGLSLAASIQYVFKHVLGLEK